MFGRLFVLALLPLSIAADGPVHGVCEVLQHLEGLSGSQVTVRGVWEIGDMGEDLYSESPCSGPTIRDGWVWRDVISTTPEDLGVGKHLQAKYFRMLTPHRHEHVKVIGTLTGRLVTRDHFEVQRLVSRREPQAFGYFVAELRYVDVADLEIVPYKPGEEAQELEWRRQPWAKPEDNKSK